MIDSVQLDNRATSVIIPFGDWKILIWEPVSSIDDTTLQELPGDQTLQGMLKEMANLNEKQTGDLYLFEDLDDLRKKNPSVTFRIIFCRWVTTRKTPETVRARIVVKDVAGNISAFARTLGISSPTPSADALFLLLGLTGKKDATLGSADVTHAFIGDTIENSG